MSRKPCWSRRTLSFVLGLMFCGPGGLWLIIQSRWQERPPEPAGPIAGKTTGEEEVLESRIG